MENGLTRSDEEGSPHVFCSKMMDPCERRLKIVAREFLDDSLQIELFAQGEEEGKAVLPDPNEVEDVRRRIFDARGCGIGRS